MTLGVAWSVLLWRWRSANDRPCRLVVTRDALRGLGAFRGHPANDNGHGQPVEAFRW